MGLRYYSCVVNYFTEPVLMEGMFVTVLVLFPSL